MVVFLFFDDWFSFHLLLMILQNKLIIDDEEVLVKLVLRFVLVLVLVLVLDAVKAYSISRTRTRTIIKYQTIHSS